MKNATVNATNNTREERKINSCGVQHVIGTEVNLKKDGFWMNTVVAIGGIWRSKNGSNNYDQIDNADSAFTYREEKIYAHKIVIQKTICHTDFQASDLTFSKKNNDIEETEKLYEFRREFASNSDLGKKLLRLHKAYKRNCICNYKREEDKYYTKTQVIAIDDKGERYQLFNIYTDCNYDINYVKNKYGYWD